MSRRSSNQSPSFSLLSRSFGRALSCALVFAISSAAPTAAFAKRMPANQGATPSRIDPIDRDEPSMPQEEPMPPQHTFAQPPPNAVAPHVEMPPPDYVVAPRPSLDRKTVRAALVQARSRNLAAFRAYQRAGVFPSNTMKGQKLNVWLDADGHFCAAATIIRKSGQEDLVNKVAEQNNFIRLADVKQGPLMDWILTSGFTQDEIAAIQEPFMPVTTEPSLQPTEPVLVDARMRAQENARLAAKYKVVDRMLIKQANKSLDQATDRLMKHAELAWQIIGA